MLCRLLPLAGWQVCGCEDPQAATHVHFAAVQKQNLVQIDLRSAWAKRPRLSGRRVSHGGEKWAFDCRVRPRCHDARSAAYRLPDAPRISRTLRVRSSSENGLGKSSMPESELSRMVYGLTPWNPKVDLGPYGPFHESWTCWCCKKGDVRDVRNLAFSRYAHFPVTPSPFPHFGKRQSGPDFKKWPCSNSPTRFTLPASLDRPSFTGVVAV